MHESHWSKCRLSWIPKICEPSTTFANSQCVLCGKLHEKIVRVLMINQWLTLIGLSGLKQKWRSSGRKSERFGAEHASQLQRAFAQLVIGHWHEPVFRIEFRYSAWTALTVKTG